MKQLIETRHLAAFAAVAKRSSFTLAASDLHLTQSAISHSIKALEDDLSVKLFERTGKRAHLTPHGDQFLRHVEKIVSEMRAARQSIEQLKTWGKSRLRIGASATACQHILPSVLREFKKQNQKCQIRVEPGDGPLMLDLLRAKKIELALMLEPPSAADISFRKLFSDELLFLVSPKHPWAAEKAAPVQQISEQTLILYSKGSYTFRMLNEYFHNQLSTPQNVIELGNIEAIKELAKIGLGAGVAPRWSATKEILEGTLIAISLGTKKLRRTWGIAQLREHKRTLSEESFMDLCSKQISKLEL